MPIELKEPLPSTMQEYSLKRFEAWREEQERLYSDPYVRVLLLAQKGLGKTTFLGTCKKPVWVASFDPGGTMSIKSEVEKGGIYVDTRFEAEDLRNPKAFNLWKDDFLEMERNRFFEQLGTYCIDSGYLWMEALLAKQRVLFHGAPTNDIMPSDALKNKDLRNLYGYFLEANLYWTRRLLSIPCNVVFTCHIDKYTDPVSGDMGTSILAPGLASKERVPVPFPEVWVIRKQRDSQQRYLLTGEEGIWRGSTRIGAGGKLEVHESPDMCAILRKCGLDASPREESKNVDHSTQENPG